MPLLACRRIVLGLVVGAVAALAALPALAADPAQLIQSTATEAIDIIKKTTPGPARQAAIQRHGIGKAAGAGDGDAVADIGGRRGTGRVIAEHQVGGAHRTGGQGPRDTLQPLTHSSTVTVPATPGDEDDRQTQRPEGQRRDCVVPRSPGDPIRTARRARFPLLLACETRMRCVKADPAEFDAVSRKTLRPTPSRGLAAACR